MAGRGDTKLTPENVIELEKRFRNGATNLEAIEGIMSESTYYEHLKTNTEFAARMELAKEYITDIAEAVLARRIVRGDVEVSKWWAERRNKKKFSLRQEMTGADGDKLEGLVIIRDADSST